MKECQGYVALMPARCVKSWFVQWVSVSSCSGFWIASRDFLDGTALLLMSDDRHDGGQMIA